jgi:hypothetical protein
MPVYGTTGPTTGGLRRRPDLPVPPAELDRVVPYLVLLDKAITDFYDELSRRLQSYVSFLTTVSFGATDTTKVITFASPLEDDAYIPLMVPSWNTRLWYSALSATGFTANASDAPGGTGGTVKVAIAR